MASRLTTCRTVTGAVLMGKRNLCEKPPSQSPAECLAARQPKRSDGLVAPVVMTLETVDGQIVTIEINNNAA